MTTAMKDWLTLAAISPGALAAYVRTEGWAKAETYGDHSDVYVGEGRPEIVIPRTRDLRDYQLVVAHLLEIFASVAELDEITLYRDLVTADRDVIRARVDGGDNTVTINEGANLVAGCRDALLAATCSLHDPRPAYRAGANQEANDFLKQVRLGQTEPGSFVVTLLPPVVPPPLQTALIPNPEYDDAPISRQVTRRLAGALSATRSATERATGGDPEAFSTAVPLGASANLCEALVQMLEPFATLDFSVTWARTRPMLMAREVVRFANDDVSILREAARSFRSREPKLDVHLFGSVQRLKRDETEDDGTITMRASIDGRTQSVAVVLTEKDYDRAIEAHKAKAPIIVDGDLDRFGQRWRLLNPRIVEVIYDEDAMSDEQCTGMTTFSETDVE